MTKGFDIFIPCLQQQAWDILIRVIIFQVDKTCGPGEALLNAGWCLKDDLS